MKRVVRLSLVPVIAFAGLIAVWRVAVLRIHRAILERLALRPGMRVVDVGCGPGWLTVPIAKQVGPAGEVVGIDREEKWLRMAEKRAAGLTNVRFLLAGVGEGRLERSYFDRAILSAVLGEIGDQEAALAEIYQALKPGGFLSVTEAQPDPHFQSVERVRDLTRAAGFMERDYFPGRLAFTINLSRPAPDSAEEER